MVCRNTYDLLEQSLWRLGLDRTRLYWLERLLEFAPSIRYAHAYRRRHGHSAGKHSHQRRPNVYLSAGTSMPCWSHMDRHSRTLLRPEHCGIKQPSVPT